MRSTTFAALAAFSVLAACAGGTVDIDADFEASQEPLLVIPGRIGDMIGERSAAGITLQGRTGDALAASVNRHLWLASLDTLSFLPIASTDPFSGVIATDWGGVTDTDLERFRVTAFITSTALAPESLRVAVHREVRQPNGPWVTAPVAPQTPRQIEDSILTRARQIRLQERGAS